MRETTLAALDSARGVDIRHALGLRPIINVSGTMTVLGASIMVPQAVAAMAAIATEFVEMDALHDAASGVIAELTGGQVGFVTASCASAITLSVAGTMTGERLLAIERLPDTSGLRNEVLVQLGHMVGYGASLHQSIAMTGARVVPVGTVSMAQPYQLDEAINEHTACAVFVVSHMTVQYAMLALETVCAVCHAKGVPVIVDAAAQLPPRENLRRFVDAGADLVLFSGGKAIGGPQASGILAGRRDLIGSALVQMMDMDVHPQTWSASPLIDRTALRGIPHHGIGRGFKVGKEEIAGLLVALERFVQRDEAAFAARLRERLVAIADALSAAGPVLQARLEPGTPETSDPAVPTLELHVQGSAHALSHALQQGDPPLHLGEGRLDVNILTLNALTVREDDDATVVRCLLAACQSLPSSPT